MTSNRPPCARRVMYNRARLEQRKQCSNPLQVRRDHCKASLHKQREKIQHPHLHRLASSSPQHFRCYTHRTAVPCSNFKVISLVRGGDGQICAHAASNCPSNCRRDAVALSYSLANAYVAVILANVEYARKAKENAKWTNWPKISTQLTA
jgi:hypothetical protein